MFTYALIHMQVYIHKNIWNAHAFISISLTQCRGFWEAHQKNYCRPTIGRPLPKTAVPIPALLQMQNNMYATLKNLCAWVAIIVTYELPGLHTCTYLLWCVVNVSLTDTRTFTGIPLMPRWSTISLTCNQPHTPCVSLVPTHLCPHIESKRHVHVQVQADVISPHIFIITWDVERRRTCKCAQCRLSCALARHIMPQALCDAHTYLMHTRISPLKLRWAKTGRRGDCRQC